MLGTNRPKSLLNGNIKISPKRKILFQKYMIELISHFSLQANDLQSFMYRAYVNYKRKKRRRNRNIFYGNNNKKIVKNITLVVKQVAGFFPFLIYTFSP